MTLGALASPTDELVQAGWEKCWSKRENRPYYFNRFTNQSLWEMPLLGQHDVIVSGWLGCCGHGLPKHPSSAGTAPWGGMGNLKALLTVLSLGFLVGPSGSERRPGACRWGSRRSNRCRKQVVETEAV